MGGGSIERLRNIMGHKGVTTTQRYSHLSPSHYGARELSAIRWISRYPRAEWSRFPSRSKAGPTRCGVGAGENEGEDKSAANT